MEFTLKHLFFPDLNNGFLHGPWSPIYGIGCCSTIAIMRFIFNRLELKRHTKIILLFFTSMLTLTIIEFITGHLIEMKTGEIFWDYSHFKFNIGHYICLEISLLWGIISLLFIYILKPITDKLINKIPTFITYIAFVTLIIDLIASQF